MSCFRFIQLAFVIPFLGCQAQQAALTPYQLKSGRVIYPKQAGPMIAPNMPKEKIWVFSYQTQLSIGDVKALEQEATEVWQDFRPKFESVPGITLAILQADEKPSGGFIQQNNSYKFVIERKADGSWQWLKDKPKGTN